MTSSGTCRRRDDLSRRHTARVGAPRLSVSPTRVVSARHALSWRGTTQRGAISSCSSAARDPMARNHVVVGSQRPYWRDLRLSWRVTSHNRAARVIAFRFELFRRGTRCNSAARDAVARNHFVISRHASSWRRTSCNRAARRSLHEYFAGAQIRFAVEALSAIRWLHARTRVRLTPRRVAQRQKLILAISRLCVRPA